MIIERKKWNGRPVLLNYEENGSYNIWKRGFKGKLVYITWVLCVVIQTLLFYCTSHFQNMDWMVSGVIALYYIRLIWGIEEKWGDVIYGFIDCG